MALSYQMQMSVIKSTRLQSPKTYLNAYACHCLSKKTGMLRKTGQARELTSKSVYEIHKKFVFFKIQIHHSLLTALECVSIAVAIIPLVLKSMYPFMHGHLFSLIIFYVVAFYLLC